MYYVVSDIISMIQHVDNLKLKETNINGGYDSFETRKWDSQEEKWAQDITDTINTTLTEPDILAR